MIGQDPSPTEASTLETTSTTAVPRVVGEPLPTWVVVGSSLALLVAILVAGTVARARIARREAAPAAPPTSG